MKPGMDAPNENESLPPNGHGDDEGPVTMPEMLRDMFTDKSFLEFADRTVDKITASIDKQNDRVGEWGRINRLFLWQRFLLSIVAMLGLGLAGAYHVISPEVLGTLAAGVVASLFITPKKD